ncbi:succinylglutamate desuccinylase/aspartoacylase domain-containing protein [Aliikangiella maris]|uniref:Succinylglutamate desuccinylase/aspartoacylase family protein n=2 Tax=Aliikangiella maris TaxID=3162458 RepID=A0ABV2BXA5_9GAMM
MKILSPIPEYFGDSFRHSIQPEALDFLHQLNGLSIIDIKGQDTSRWRVVTTLIHGNEPSGFIATHWWLKQAFKPITNIRIIICNPEAAQIAPAFSQRYIPSGEDLNRFFAEPLENDHEIAIRARQIKRAIEEVRPEAVIDLHNTSGNSPAFAVSIYDSIKELALAELFTQKFIFTGLKVGALMEQSLGAPIVTVECGGANQIRSHQVACDGLAQYFTLNDLFERETKNMSVHRHPIRVELVDKAVVGFAQNKLPTCNITFREDIEQFNQKQINEGEFLGWYNQQQQLPLKATDEQGVNRIGQLIETRNNEVYAKQSMQLFMITTLREIATKDCLFYATLNH